MLLRPWAELSAAEHREPGSCLCLWKGWWGFSQYSYTMDLLDKQGYLQLRDCNREMLFPWLLRLSSSSSGSSILSCLQFLWKHRFPCLMVIGAASGSKISGNLILQILPWGLLQWLSESELEHWHVTCVCAANLGQSILRPFRAFSPHCSSCSVSTGTQELLL